MAVQDADVPRRAAEAHRRRRERQLHRRGHAPVHRGRAAGQVLGPQHQRGEQEEQRDPVRAAGQARRHRAVRGPDHGPGEGQAVAQRVVLDVGGHAGQAHAVAAAQHRADARQRHGQPRGHQPAGALAVEGDRGQHREGRPQVVHHAHLDRLLAAARMADGQRQAQLVAHEQHAAPRQVAARERAQRRETHRRPQQGGGSAVDHRRAAHRAQALAHAADQADDRCPQNDGDQPDAGGAVSFFHHRIIEAPGWHPAES